MKRREKSRVIHGFQRGTLYQQRDIKLYEVGFSRGEDRKAEKELTRFQTSSSIRHLRGDDS